MQAANITTLHQKMLSTLYSTARAEATTDQFYKKKRENNAVRTTTDRGKEEKRSAQAMEVAGRS